MYLFKIYLKARVGKPCEELRQLYLIVLTEDIFHREDALLPLSIGHILKLGKGMGIIKSKARGGCAAKRFHTTATAKTGTDVGTESTDIRTL